MNYNLVILFLFLDSISSLFHCNFIKKNKPFALIKNICAEKCGFDCNCEKLNYTIDNFVLPSDNNRVIDNPQYMLMNTTTLNKKRKKIQSMKHLPYNITKLQEAIRNLLSKNVTWDDGEVSW